MDAVSADACSDNSHMDDLVWAFPFPWYRADALLPDFHGCLGPLLLFSWEEVKEVLGEDSFSAARFFLKHSLEV